MDAKEVLKLCDSMSYIKGIVERGETRKLDDNEPIDIAVLNYVKHLEQQLQQATDSHYFTLNCLKGTLEQLKGGIDRKVIIEDIEQYIIDLEGVE